MNLNYMTNKLLSIAIPSFNMQEYLPRCLDSLILDDEELMQMLDIIVVNDGSTDLTSKIAHKYASRYPGIVQVVDKPNGHYGSCINAALAVAKGKYFRILDADDWFDTESLAKFITELTNVDVDCVCTNCIDVRDEEQELIRIKGLPYEETIDLQRISSFDKYIHMHHIAYRTSLLREMNYKQTEGICYTDEEFAYYPLIRSKSLYLIDLPLYYYFIGRADQSINKEVSRRIKHHYFKVAKRMTETPIDKVKDNKVAMDIRMKKIAFLMGSEILPHYVLFRKMSKTENAELKNILDTIKREKVSVYNSLLSGKVRNIPVYKIWKTSPRLANFIFYHIFKLAAK